MSKKEATLKDLLDAINGLRNDFKSNYSASTNFNKAQEVNSKNEERQSKIEKNQAETSKLISETAAQTIQNQNAQKFFDQQYQKNNIEIGNQLAKLQESLLRANVYRDSLNNRQNNKSFNFTDLFRHNANNTTNNDINWNERINTIINNNPDNIVYEEKVLKLHNDLAQKIEEQSLRLSKAKQERIINQTKIEKEQKTLELKQLTIEDKLKQREFIEKKNKLDLIELEAKIERNRERDQAWREDRERELVQREKEDKQLNKESYKENFLYRSGQAIQGAHTGFGTSLMMSALTGGAINPAIIQALKLDKLLTAPLAAFGKSLLRSNKAGKSTSAVKSKKYSEITDRIDKANGTLDKLAAPKNKEEKKKNEKGIFEKIGDFFGSLGGIGSLLGMSGIALLIKHLFPKTIKAIGDRFSDFLEDRFGLSENTADDLSKVIGYAITGFTLSKFSLKGALIGAGIGLAKASIDSMVARWNGDIENNKNPEAKYENMGFKEKSEMVLSGAILGATLGPGISLKGALIGAGIAYAATQILDLKTRFQDIIDNGFTLENTAELAGKLGVLGTGILGAIYGFKAGGLKGAFIGAGVAIAGEAAFKVGEWLGEKSFNAIHGEEIARMENNKRKLFIDQNMEAAEKAKFKQWLDKTGKWEAYTKGYTEEDGKYWGKNKVDVDYEKLLLDFNEYLNKGNNISEFNISDTAKKKIEDKIDGIPDKEGNGYGSYNPSLLNYSGNTYKQRLVSNANRLGINPILLEDMSLKGSINNPWTAGGNSIPAINEKNRDNLTELDNKLSEWGYDVVYTSAMGGHVLNSGHGRGNKVDLQLKKNGQTAHLTTSELYALRDAGYWGTGTGALGWEPVSGQVGGGHYDLFVGGHNSNIETPSKLLGGSHYDEGISLAGGYSNNSGNNMLDLFTGVYKGISSLQNNNFSLDTDNIPSSEMANTNALTQLSNAIGGTSNDSNNNSLSNIMADVASNIAHSNQISNQPIVYNNISNTSSSDDNNVYPVGDLAKTLLYT